MNTSLANREPQLLVDIETGRVLRADDRMQVTQRYLDSHPFIEQAYYGERTYFAGPDAARAARAHSAGEPIRHLDVVQYEVADEIGGYLRLQRVVEE